MSSSSEKKEMLVIDINYGKGKRGEILVSYGDSASTLATNFVKKYGLKKKSQITVQKHIEQVVADFQEKNGMDPSEGLVGSDAAGPKVTKRSSSSGEKHENIDYWDMKTNRDFHSWSSGGKKAASTQGTGTPPRSPEPPSTGVSAPALPGFRSPAHNSATSSKSASPLMMMGPHHGSSWEEYEDSRLLERVDLHTASDRYVKAYRVGTPTSDTKAGTSDASKTDSESTRYTKENPTMSQTPEVVVNVKTSSKTSLVPEDATVGVGVTTGKGLSSAPAGTKSQQGETHVTSVDAGAYEVVNTHGTFIRAIPSTHSSMVRNLDAGELVECTGEAVEEEGIVFIHLKRDEGWVPLRTKAGELIMRAYKEPQEAVYKIVYEHGTFVRDCCSSNAVKLGELDFGDTLLCTGQIGEDKNDGRQYMQLSSGGWVPILSSRGHPVLRKCEDELESERSKRQVLQDRVARTVQEEERRHAQLQAEKEISAEQGGGAVSNEAIEKEPEQAILKSAAQADEMKGKDEKDARERKLEVTKKVLLEEAAAAQARVAAITNSPRAKIPPTPDASQVIHSPLYKVVFKNGTFIRDSPKKDAKLLGDLQYGDTLEVTGRQVQDAGGLHYMELAHGSGWVQTVSRAGAAVIEPEVNDVNDQPFAGGVKQPELLQTDDTPDLESKSEPSASVPPQSPPRSPKMKVVFPHGTFIRDSPSRNARRLNDLDNGDVVEVTGTSKLEEGGLEYMELAANKGWVPMRSHKGHQVLRQISLDETPTKETMPVENANTLEPSVSSPASPVGSPGPPRTRDPLLFKVVYPHGTYVRDRPSSIDAKPLRALDEGELVEWTHEEYIEPLESAIIDGEELLQGGMTFYECASGGWVPLASKAGEKVLEKDPLSFRGRLLKGSRGKHMLSAVTPYSWKYREITLNANLRTISYADGTQIKGTVDISGGCTVTTKFPNEVGSKEQEMYFFEVKASSSDGYDTLILGCNSLVLRSKWVERISRVAASIASEREQKEKEQEEKRRKEMESEEPDDSDEIPQPDPKLYRVIFEHGTFIRENPVKDSGSIGDLDYDDLVEVTGKEVPEEGTGGPIYMELVGGGYVPIFSRSGLPVLEADVHSYIGMLLKQSKTEGLFGSRGSKAPWKQREFTLHSKRQTLVQKDKGIVKGVFDLRGCEIATKFPSEVGAKEKSGFYFQVTNADNSETLTLGVDSRWRREKWLNKITAVSAIAIAIETDRIEPLAPVPANAGPSTVIYKVVYEYGTYIRDDPSRTANSLGDVEFHDIVECTGHAREGDDGLVYMQLANGKGWIPMISRSGHTVIEVVDQPRPHIYRVIFDHGSFIRDIPSSTANSIGELQYDDILIATGFTQQESGGLTYAELSEDKGWVPLMTKAGRRVLERDHALEAATDSAWAPASAEIQEQTEIEASHYNIRSSLGGSGAAGNEYHEKQRQVLEWAQKASDEAHQAARRANSRLAEARALSAQHTASDEHVTQSQEHQEWLSDQHRLAAAGLNQTEELYNRMQANITASAKKRMKASGLADVDASRISMASDHGRWGHKDFDPSTLKVSTSFALTTRMGETDDYDDTSNSSIPQNAHHRLFQTAKHRNRHRDNMYERGKKEKEIYLDQHRFTMGDTSRALAANLSRPSRRGNQLQSDTHDENDLLHRLYEDGKKEHMKKKIAEELKANAGIGPTRIDHWSCVQCGTYHRIDHDHLIALEAEIQSSKVMHQRSMSGQNTGITQEAAAAAKKAAIKAAEVYRSKLYVCTSCGFEKRGAFAPHHPQILSLDKAKADGSIDRLLARRNQAIHESGGIVEYLRSTHQHVQGEVSRQRKQWERKESELTFKPKINDISKQLIESKIAVCRNIRGDNETPQAGYEAVDDISKSRSDLNHFHLDGSVTKPAKQRTNYGGSHGYLTKDGTHTKYPTAKTIGRSEEDRIRAKKQQTGDRAVWLRVREIANKKAELTEGTTYTHDSKNMEVSQYFDHSITDRLSQNIKPHIVKRKHRNSNKYISEELSPANTSISIHTDDPSTASAARSALSISGNPSNEAKEKMRSSGTGLSEEFYKRNQDWRKQNEANKQLLRDRLQEWDEKAAQPLYTPKVGPEPPSQSNSSVNPAGTNTTFSTTKSGGSVDIVTRLAAKDAATARRKAALLQKRHEQLDQESERKQVTALPQSKEILAKARERSINEMFRLLLVSVNGSTFDEEGNRVPLTDNATLSRLSAQVSLDEDERSGENRGDTNNTKMLDLAMVEPELMIPEVTELLLEVCNEKEDQELEALQSYQTEKAKLEQEGDLEENDRAYSVASDNVSMNVSYWEFRSLVLRCMDRRGKGNSIPFGKSYIYTNRKRSDTHITKMMAEELAEETFTPMIGSRSEELVSRSGRYPHHNASTPSSIKKAKPISEHLQMQGEKLTAQINAMRLQKQEKEDMELTFKPKLYKPMKGVTARYRSVDSLAEPFPHHIIEKKEKIDAAVAAANATAAAVSRGNIHRNRRSKNDENAGGNNNTRSKSSLSSAIISSKKTYGEMRISTVDTDVNKAALANVKKIAAAKMAAQGSKITSAADSGGDHGKRVTAVRQAAPPPLPAQLSAQTSTNPSKLGASLVGMVGSMTSIDSDDESQ